MHTENSTPRRRREIFYTFLEEVKNEVKEKKIAPVTNMYYKKRKYSLFYYSNIFK